MCDNSEQRQPRSLADIVREKTNDGDTIVQFYLDVANGKLDDEGFEACHRRDAAMQIQAIAPELVAEAIARLAGVQCHPERRTKRPIRRSRAVGNPSPDATRANAAAARPRIPGLGPRGAIPRRRPPRRRHRPREHRPGQDRRQLPAPRNARRRPGLQAQQQDGGRQGAHRPHSPRRAPRRRSPSR